MIELDDIGHGITIIAITVGGIQQGGTKLRLELGPIAIVLQYLAYGRIPDRPPISVFNCIRRVTATYAVVGRRIVRLIIPI